MPDIPASNGAINVEEDFYAVMRAEAKKMLEEERRAADAAARGVPATPALDASEPVKLNIFGQEREFKDLSEISTAVEGLVKEYQAAVANPQVVVAPQPLGPAEPPKVDLDEFVNRIQKDPGDAFDFALKSKYGVGLDYLLNQARRTEEIEGALTVIQFKEMNEDYTPNPQNTQILNGIRANLGLPFSVQGLSAAYAVGKQYGLFAPGGQNVPTRPAPPPSINTSRATSPSQSEDIIAMVEGMSADKAAEFVNRMYARN